MTMHTYNEVILEGSPLGEPERSHENHGQLFFRQLLEVPRLSGTPDVLPLLLRQEHLPLLEGGCPLRIRGQLRSFNNRGGTGRRLVLTVYTQVIEPGEGEAVNRITLTGTLCKPPVYRRTHLRPDSGRPQKLWPGGLPAGDRMGAGRLAGQRSGRRRSSFAGGAGTEPDLSENDGNRPGGAGRL